MSSTSKPRHKSIFGSPGPSQNSNEDQDEDQDEDALTSSEDAVSPLLQDRQPEFPENLPLDEKDENGSEFSDDQDESRQQELDSPIDDRQGFSRVKTRQDEVKWRLHTTKELAVERELGELEARDLTTQILNTHGIIAVQYEPQLGNIGEPGYSSENTENNLFHRFNTRAQNVPNWTPRVSWTRWPLRPSTVPRKQKRVWASSISKPEEWKPSGELEQCLFAFLLRTARFQWNARERMDSEFEPPSKRLKVETDPESEDDIDEYATEVEEVEEAHEIPQRTKAEEQGNRVDAPVFSADDERSWRILKPVIRSTVTTLDGVLSALYRSQKGSKSIQNKSESMNRHSRSPRDWSHVLGLAAIAGVPPAVISRATTRCSAALHESMAFNLLREEDTSQKITPPTIYRPNDVRHNDPDSRLLEPPMNWTLEDGCPFKDCSWYGHRRQPTGTDKKVRILEHLQRAHRWYMGIPTELEESISDMSGGVHIDGFMQPIVPKSGWRARDRKVRKTSSRARPRDFAAFGDESSSVGPSSPMPDVGSEQ